MPISFLNKKKALSTARSLINDGRWRELLDLHPADTLGGVGERLLLFIMLAALEVENEPHIRAAVEQAQQRTLSAAAAVTLVGYLINANRFADAWHILRTTNPAGMVERFSILCPRIARKTSDPVVSKAAMERYRECLQSTGGVLAKSMASHGVPSEYTFAEHAGSATVPAGTIQIVARPGISSTSTLFLPSSTRRSRGPCRQAFCVLMMFLSTNSVISGGGMVP